MTMNARLKETAHVTGIEWLDSENALLGLNAPEAARLAQPGQFVLLAAGQMLNRPLGVALTDPESGMVTVGIKKVGSGTGALLDLEQGSAIRLLGPFGHGFSLDNVNRAYVVGGGTGIFPLLFLLHVLRSRGVETFAGCGFRTLQQALLQEDFSDVSDQYLTACESGGGDVSGTAVDALDALYLGHGRTERTRVFACGPIPMLQAVNRWCETHDVAAECSFEARMGCGFGICRGCAVPVLKAGALDYDRCCVEGPVFDRRRIAWEALS